ncbi:PTS sugar transporter subunit IIB [Brachyspira pilosicoli]|uniref:PTS sugar transporter subunit IIB n=1 Tax=Brachyspira pilosicoli TaxID=52584 RepID=UPI0012F5231B|nr:PTS sugar transporter subunit IIB [Brachyspira pilosicoli]
MIKQVRVDHRLLHGQVAVTWLQSLDIDAILITNDQVVNDEITKTTLKLAKPNNCKLIFKTVDDSINAILSGVTDSYKLFIIFENITDALKLSRATKVIKSINLGGTKHPDGSKKLSKSVSITKSEEEDIRAFMKEFPEVELEIRALPNDQKQIIKDI